MKEGLCTGVAVVLAGGVLRGSVAFVAAAEVLRLEGVEELAVWVRALHDLVLVGRAVPLFL